METPKQHQRKAVDFFRARAMGELALRGTRLKPGRRMPKSVKIFLRREIARQRELISMDELRERQQAGKSNSRDLFNRQFAAMSIEPKRYGGYPRDDNPQTWSIQEERAENQRRYELEDLSGNHLKEIIYELLHYDDTGSAHTLRNSGFYQKLNRLHNYEPALHGVLYSVSQKQEMIEVILKSERAIKDERKQ